MPVWLIFGLLSAFFAALVAIFGKIGLVNIDATLATAVRGTIMAIFLIAVVLVQGKWIGLPDLISQKKGLFFIVLSGIAGALSWLCYFFAIQHGEIAKVAPIDKLSVVIAVVVAVLFLGERLSLVNAIGVIAIAGGSLLVALG